MSINEFIKWCVERSISFSLLGSDQLKVNAAPGSLTDEVKAQLKERKADILAWLKQRQRERIAPLSQGKNEFPLSFAQQRLWFVDRLQKGSAEYNNPMPIQVSGKFNLDIAEQALRQIIQRHDILRTVYREDEDVVQVILSEFEFSIPQQDLTSIEASERETKLNALIDDDMNRSFSLERDLMLRASFIKLSQQSDGEIEGVLLINIHHIACDGWSLDLLMREFVNLYQQLNETGSVDLPELSLRYADYVLWQREWLNQDELGEQTQYWTQQLADAPLIHGIPLDYPRPRKMSHSASVVRGRLPAQWAGKLQSVAKEKQVTSFMLCHAILSLLLARHGHSDDILIGTPVANRKNRELESLIGFFANTMVLRSNIEQESFSQLLEHIKQVNLDAQQNQDVPFDFLIENLNVPRSSAHSPLFQIMFSLSTESAYGNESNTFTLPDVAMSMLKSEAKLAKFDLDIYANINEEGIQFYWIYNDSLFSHERVEQFNQHLEHLFQAVLSTPDALLSELDMLSESEKQYLTHELNPVAIPSSAQQHTQHIHTQFEQAARSHPDATAVVFNGQILTYKELNQRANQLAHYLVEQGVKPDSFVGLCMDKSLEMIISILGILKAGGTYVPLEPTYPDDRLSHILNDCDMPLVIASSEARVRLSTMTNARFITLVSGSLASQFEAYSSDNISVEDLALAPSSLAYVIYTSGSTGKPKGVLQTHENVSRLFASTWHLFEFNERDTWLLFHSICFDFTVWELWGALFYGGKLVVPEAQLTRDAQRVVNLCAEQQVTVLNQTPSAFKAFTEAAVAGQQTLSDIRYVIFGGEAFEPFIIKPWFKRFPDSQTQFINMYGITETTVHASYWKVDDTEISQSIIGHKLADQTFYLLDKHQNLVPNHAVGELYIGGAGLARGYLNRPELTKERFIPDPFSQNPEDRLYRTGDLVRYVKGNQLAYMGRADEQVKIRGFRIELGEISNQINHCDFVSASAVITRKAVDDTLQIVAYVVFDTSIFSQADAEQMGAELLIAKLRAALGEVLPDYMVPAAFVALERIPLTSNGKIDRSKLPEPDFSSLAENYVAPESELEIQLAQVWGDLLKLEPEKISVTANFFDLGGHSLLSVRLLAKVREQMQCQLDVSAIFEHSTIRELAACIENGQTNVATSDIPLLDRSSNDSQSNGFALSAQQEQLWFIDKMQDGSAEYNINIALDIQGAFDATIAESVIAEIVQRHEILRTIYLEKESGPVQVIQSNPEFSLQIQDLSGENVEDKESLLKALLSQDAARSFNLEHDLLLRALLVKLCEIDGAQRSVFMFTVHHIACDGWSISLLVQEFIELYQSRIEGRASSLALLTIQYVDYASWSLNMLDAGKLEEQQTYWRQALDNLPQVHSLPLDKPRPQQQSFQGGKVGFEVDAALMRSLKGLAKENNATLFMVIHAAFSLLLSRYSNEQDIAIGVPVANRHNTALQPLVGFFMNTLVLRTQCNSQLNFVDYLKQVKQVSLDALKHQDIPFQMVLKDVDPVRTQSHSPLFQIMLSMDNNERVDVELGELSIKPYAAKQLTSKFDMILHVDEIHDNVHFAWEFNADIFVAETVEKMAGHFVQLLTSIVAQPKANILALPMVSEQEKEHFIQRLNPERQGHRDDIMMHELFIEQVQKTPDNIAVIDVDGELTYAQVFTAALHLAEVLQKHNIQVDELVAVRIPKGRYQVIATLAIMMAGGAYLPMETHWPEERCIKVCNKAQSSLLLMIDDKDALAMPQLQVLNVREIAAKSDESAENVQSVVEQVRSFASKQSPKDLAYVIFTSGSTGEPKGVAIEHHAAVNTLLEMNRYYVVTESDKVLAVSALSFDLSVYDIFGLLAAGGAIVFPEHDYATDPAHWLQLIEQHQVTLWDTVPASAGLLVDHIEATSKTSTAPIRHVLMSGDWIAPNLPARLWKALPCCQTHSLGGATEGSIWSIHYPIEQDTSGWKSVPYGKPMFGQSFYILNEAGQFVPQGVIGELHIGGRGVARGYFGDPEQTQARFIWHEEIGDRLYKTGDMGRYFPDGNIEFIGRIDHQVKLRGFRIELGEIEARLNQLYWIDEAIVLIRGEHEFKQLVAYVVIAKDCQMRDATDAELALALKSHLAGSLPDYMIPAAFMALDDLPLTANGKVDKKALPEPDFTVLFGQYVAPETATENALVLILAELLGLGSEKVSVAANFFELGGNSLLLIRLVTQINNRFNLSVKVNQLFDKQNVQQIAKFIDSILSLKSDTNLDNTDAEESEEFEDFAL